MISRRKVFVLCANSVAAILAANNYASAAAISLGVNLSVVDIDKSKIEKCASANDHGGPISGRAFLPKYASSAVRERVKRSLEVLKSHGTTSIRTLIWFSEKSSQDGNVIGIDDAEELGRNLTLFSDDMLQAGIARLMISFSPQSHLAPACRGSVWGDCFVKDSLQESTSLILNVRRSFEPASDLDLWLDLNNEGVPAENLPIGARNAFIEYMRYVVPHYRSVFPLDRISISMQAGPLDQRMRYLLENFDVSGAGPDFYSLHLYKSSAPDPMPVLEALIDLIRTHRRPIFIGEIEDDPVYYSGVYQFLQSAIGEDCRGVLVWPLRNPRDQCAIDTEPDEISFK
jgi:hypothetical protein